MRFTRSAPAHSPSRHRSTRLGGFALLGLFAPILAGAAPLPVIGDDFQVNTYTTGHQYYTATAIAPGGEFVIVWASIGEVPADDQDGSYSGIFAQLFTSDGSASGDEIAVNTATVLNQADPDVAFLSDGGFVVVWDSDSAQDGSYRGIIARRFDSGGSANGGELIVNQVTLGHQNDGVVAAQPGGGFVVAWETQELASAYEDLVFRRFDSAGDPIGDEMPINTFTTDDQEDVDIATDANGNFVVTWESQGQDGHYDSIVARRFASDGMALGDEILVNRIESDPDSYLYDQENPALAVHDDGRFLVVWENETPLKEWIVARAFASDGSPLSDPWQADTNPADEVLPDAALASNGDPLLVWTSYGLDGDGAGIVGNRFALDGTTLAVEQVVNSYTTSGQGAPKLAVNELGQAIVVFDGVQTGDFEVYARRLDIPLFADGFESGDTSAWAP